jgi:hypothetical protein
MSAPPIAAVVVNPLIKLRAAFVAKKAAATSGAVGAAERKPAIVRAFAPRSELLTKCRLGNIKGLEDMRPASLRKATIEPVKVIPPDRTDNHHQMKTRQTVAGTIYLSRLLNRQSPGAE